ncbi:MAG: radical SAM protein [Armatimonadetes bacterium]|nr:radical SAM protein [Armatimonadota bacterium]
MNNKPKHICPKTPAAESYAGSSAQRYVPRLIFWEMTTACNLKCIHCRACPVEERSPDDLTTAEAKAMLDQFVSAGGPAVVLSGGEPLVRPDWFEIASYGASIGLRMLLATNGTLVTPEIAGQIAEAGIKRVSVSIDGATAATHDEFRRIPGAFEQAWAGVEHIKAAGVPFQINTTVSKHNIDEVPTILDMAIERGAVAFHIFLLVPTGCGKEITDEEMIDPENYERVLAWFYEQSKNAKIDLKATCAPHYARISRQLAAKEKVDVAASGNTPHSALNSHQSSRGCLAGQSVCFVSHLGEFYPCGYLPVSAGNIRKLSFNDIWEHAEVFNVLRNPDNLQGKCGQCEFRRACMGCRARAYGITGNYLGQEPYCIYEPKGTIE